MSGAAPAVAPGPAGVGRALWCGLRPVLPALALGIAAWAAMFHTEIARAVQVWNGSTAYSHCWFVLPLALYLAWDRRAAAAGLAPRPILWPAALALPGALAWLAAERTGLMEARQLAAIGLLDLLLLAVLGWRLARVFSAALLYLFFLVPFGAFLTPALQRFTAAFTDAGLRLLGIPYYMDRFTIEIPGGVFFIAEACAGLRFLIAAIAFGVLYACLIYRNPWRRAGFIALSCVVPVIANGLRALGIVVLGDVLGSAQAAAADHVVYGWLFFSFVLLSLILAGLPFREDIGPAPAPPPVMPRAAGGAPWPAMALLVGAAAAGPVLAAAIDFGRAPPAAVALPAFAAGPGCVAAPGGVPGRQVFACVGFPLTASLRVFPVRANPGELLAALRAATGEEHSEDTVVSRLDGWRLAETQQPAALTATMLWIDGAPSPAGLGARLRQARNSLLGGGFAPVLATVRLDADGPMDRRRRDAARQAMHGFLQAQAELPAAAGRLAAAAAR